MDDLSFEENETNYKDLKAVLEGGWRRARRTWLLYATSNRRHLIPERFSDRDHVDPERFTPAIRRREAVAQRPVRDHDHLPLAGSRGLPAIVEGLAKRLRLEWPAETLRGGALQWAARYNGWSGRSARQFIHFALGRAGAGRQRHTEADRRERATFFR